MYTKKFFRAFETLKKVIFRLLVLPAFKVETFFYKCPTFPSLLYFYVVGQMQSKPLDPFGSAKKKKYILP